MTTSKSSQPLFSPDSRRLLPTFAASAVAIIAAAGLVAAPAGAAVTKKSAGITSSASGTVAVNGVTTKIRYGYARQTTGFFDAKKNDVEIVLSDVPLVGASLTDSFERGNLASKGTIHTFEIILNSAGVPVSSSFRHGGFKGPSPSGFDTSDVLTMKSFSSKRVEARFKSAKEHEFFGDTYAFDVSFALSVSPKSK
jgi:hypothetical protein